MPGEVSVIARALDILCLFERSPTPLSMMAIAHQTGLHKATAFRLLSTLVEDQLLHQTASGEYELGFFATQRAITVLRADPLWVAARPIMEALRTNLNESVVLTRRFEDDCVDLDFVSASTPVMQAPPLGRRLPLHKTSAGRMLLASLRPALQEQYVARAALPALERRDVLAALRAPSGLISEVIKDAMGEPVAVIWLAVPPGRAIDSDRLARELLRACDGIPI
jgi:DNA-binding IclR family transcriptional regulator